MAILSQCPMCKTRQPLANKRCKCGENLDRAKKSGRVRYWVTYHLPGNKKKWELAGVNLDDAKTTEADRRLLKQSGKLPEVMRGAKLTFNGLTEWYLKLESTKALASYEIIKLKLEKFNSHALEGRAAFGAWKVNTITAADLKEYQTRLQNKGLKPGTVDQDLGKVKAMVNAAFLNGKVGADAFRAFKAIRKTLVKGSDVRDRVLTAEEFSRLLKHAEGHTRGILAVAYFTGMRRGEILGLTWDRVDLARRLIYLEARHTKDKEPRRVPICAELLRILQEMPGRLEGVATEPATEARRVFTYHGQPIKGEIRAGIRRACKLAGLPYGRNSRDGLTLHDLRHTFTTNMRRAGVPEPEIMAITGHSSRSTFDRYNTVDEADLRRAIERLEDSPAFSSLFSSKPEKENPAEAGSLEVTT